MDIKVKVKIVGALPPHPRKLFVKSLIKNFDMGDFIGAAYTKSQFKSFDRTFSKVRGGLGAEPPRFL